MKQLLCRLVSEVQNVVEEAGGNLKHLSAMEEVALFLRNANHVENFILR